MRFQCPKGTDAVVLDHIQYDADLEGVIDAPARLNDRLVKLKFKPLGPALKSFEEFENEHED
jgi:hypothetical protein